MLRDALPIVLRQRKCMGPVILFQFAVKEYNKITTKINFYSSA